MTPSGARTTNPPQLHRSEGGVCLTSGNPRAPRHEVLCVISRWWFHIFLIFQIQFHYCKSFSDALKPPHLHLGLVFSVIFCTDSTKFMAILHHCWGGHIFLDFCQHVLPSKSRICSDLLKTWGDKDNSKNITHTPRSEGVLYPGKV